MNSKPVICFKADDDVQDEQHAIFHCTHPHTLSFAGDLSPYFKGKSEGCFCTRTTTNSIFST
jgi:hypothetical protein